VGQYARCLWQRGTGSGREDVAEEHVGVVVPVAVNDATLGPPCVGFVWIAGPRDEYNSGVGLLCDAQRGCRSCNARANDEHVGGFHG